MKESVVTAFLSILCAILLIGVIAGSCLLDRTAPEISLNGKNTLTYIEGDSYDVLLEGMTAEDGVDGDVTDTIRVSNIYVTGDGKAIVVYVAKDSSNNIAKLKREIRYKKKEVVESTGTESQTLPVKAGIESLTGR